MGLGLEPGRTVGRDTAIQWQFPPFLALRAVLYLKPRQQRADGPGQSLRQGEQCQVEQLE